MRFKLINPAPELKLLEQAKGPLFLDKHITHGIVGVNQLVIDPVGHKRFGTDYPEKDNYPLREALELWETLITVTPIRQKIYPDLPGVVTPSDKKAANDGANKPTEVEIALDFYRDVGDTQHSAHSSAGLRRDRSANWTMLK